MSRGARYHLEARADLGRGGSPCTPIGVTESSLRAPTSVSPAVRVKSSRSCPPTAATSIIGCVGTTVTSRATSQAATVASEPAGRLARTGRSGLEGVPRARDAGEFHGVRPPVLRFDAHQSLQWRQTLQAGASRQGVELEVSQPRPRIAPGLGVIHDFLSLRPAQTIPERHRHIKVAHNDGRPAHANRARTGDLCGPLEGRSA